VVPWVSSTMVRVGWGEVINGGFGMLLDARKPVNPDSQYVAWDANGMPSQLGGNVGRSSP
jgi:hypothetical protein